MNERLGVIEFDHAQVDIFEDVVVTTLKDGKATHALPSSRQSILDILAKEVSYTIIADAREDKESVSIRAEAEARKHWTAERHEEETAAVYLSQRLADLLRAAWKHGWKRANGNRAADAAILLQAEQIAKLHVAKEIGDPAYRVGQLESGLDLLVTMMHREEDDG